MARCRARQVSDQMVCRQCGLAWDVNDHDPPACRADTSPNGPEPKPSKRQQDRARTLQHLDDILAELQAGK